jgi:hypothetical protein
MSVHLELVHQSIDPSSIRASAEGIRVAVAVTDEELITAKAGVIKRWSKVERFSLSDLSGLRTVPNPSANLLQVEFSDGSSKRVVAIMYPPQSVSAFEQITAYLRKRLNGRKSGANHGN